MTTMLPETDLPELLFEGGLAGFPDSHRFALIEVEGSALYRLRSTDTAGLEFVVAPPVVFFPGYAPELDAESAARLELESPDDALLLVILTLGPGVGSATANLRAPVVVNARTRRAAQVLLTSDEHSLREPVRAG